MAKIDVDLASFRAGFPKGAPAPKLLLDFGTWLKKIPHGSLGYFDSFASEPLDDTYVSDDVATERLRAKLGIFLHLPDGSRLAMWDYGGKIPAVVLIGSEGDLENVAPNVETFLHALANGKTGVSELDNAKASASRPLLSAWLKKQKIVAKTAKISPFQEWFDDVVESAIASAPVAKKIKAGRAPADLIARVEALIGKLADDPAVIALCAELGFDLPSIRDADRLRSLAQPKEGFALEFAWPWDYPNKSLAKEFPKEKKKSVKSRMLWGISVCADGYKNWSRATGTYVVYDGFRGTLPNGLSFKDKLAAAKKKFPKPTYEDDEWFKVYDAKRDFTYGVNFADETEGKIKKGAMTYVNVRRRSGFEP